MASSSFSNSAPMQKRLDTNIPAPTCYQAPPTMDAMHNQWKTSSMYITESRPWSALNQTPNMVPVEYTPGSTSQGTRRLNFFEKTLPYGKNTVPGPKAMWPPTLETSHNFKLANYPSVAYGGAHLTRRTITAGLGGIDPTM